MTCQLQLLLNLQATGKQREQDIVGPNIQEQGIPFDVVDGNINAAWENQTDQKLLQKCEYQNGQYINVIKPTTEKTNAEVDEKSCEKINDENQWEINVDEEDKGNINMVGIVQN